jgi:hypothetical protein
MQLLVHYCYTLPSCPLFDNLVAINCFIVLKTYDKLHSFDPSLRLYSIGSSCGMPLCHHFLMTLLNHLVDELIIAYPLTYCLFA